MPYLFVRMSDSPQEMPEHHLQDNKFFEDAIFEFVYQVLGYKPIHIEGKDLKVEEV